MDLTNLGYPRSQKIASGPEDIAKHAVRTVIQTLNAQALVVGNRHFDLTFGNGWNTNHF